MIQPRKWASQKRCLGRGLLYLLAVSPSGHPGVGMAETDTRSSLSGAVYCDQLASPCRTGASGLGLPDIRGKHVKCAVRRAAVQWNRVWAGTSVSAQRGSVQESRGQVFASLNSSYCWLHLTRRCYGNKEGHSAPCRPAPCTSSETAGHFSL